MSHAITSISYEAKQILCQRCGKTAYAPERTAPINGVVFHRACFSCARCTQKLTLRTYYTNQAQFGDKEIYCERDSPRLNAYGLDASALGIKFAMRYVRGKGYNPSGTHVPMIDSDAMLIKHPLGVQNILQKKYQTFSRHHFNPLYSV